MISSRALRLGAVSIALLLLSSLLTSPASARDLAIWDKLKSSNPRGYVLLIRHGLAPGVGDPENFSLKDCSTQRNLSNQGRQDMAEIGQWIKRQEVRIYRVESSRWCRARQSAELLDLGRVKLNKNLDSLFQVADPSSSPATANIRKRIISHRNTPGLLIFVGHFVNFSTLTGVALDSGEGVLVRANSKGELKVMGFSPAP